VGKSFFIWHFLMPKWWKRTKKQKGAKAPFFVGAGKNASRRT
jgi:hypothetical protein